MSEEMSGGMTREQADILVRQLAADADTRRLSKTEISTYSVLYGHAVLVKVQPVHTWLGTWLDSYREWRAKRVAGQIMKGESDDK